MKLEQKLIEYDGYTRGRFTKWKSQIKIPEQCINKIINSIWILNTRNIRELLRIVVQKNKKLIESENSFICKFGEVGKSGEILIYQFRHTFPKYRNKIIELWEIPALPAESKIIFLDDLIGTGTQSTKHITGKLALMLNPTHQAYLLCLCATPQGIEKVSVNTNIKVLPAIILTEKNYQYLSNHCNVFDTTEKTFLFELNQRLTTDTEDDYCLGLLLAFCFAVPNNTLPFIWKDKASYLDTKGVQKKWYALLPRYY